MTNSADSDRPSRRRFLWNAGAAALLTAVDGMKAHAQNAPTVLEVDAKDLFDTMARYTTGVMEDNFSRRRTGVSDPVYGFSQEPRSLDDWNASYPEMLKGWNGDAVLRGFYVKAFTDQRRATILAFKEMGGVQWAEKTGVSGFMMTADDDGVGLFASPSAIDSAIRVFGNTSTPYGKEKMPFITAVATNANDLLWSAYSGQYKTGNLNAFLQGPAMRDPVFAPTRKAAMALGIQPSGTALASNVPRS